MRAKPADREDLTRISDPTRHHAIRRLGAHVMRAADRMLPHGTWIDGKFRLLRFWQANGRLPRPSTHPAATFNDFILERMIRDDWTPLERACVDKDDAKFLAAAMCANVMVSETRLVIPLMRDSDKAKAVRLLSARVGRAEVAKPTHGSGNVLFLRKCGSAARITEFCALASKSYHSVSRESQYKGLLHKIIVEDDLSGAHGAPEDYKFFCSHGEVLFCQIDIGRFTRHQRVLVTPAFEPIDVRFAHDRPDIMPRPPANFARMIEAAQQLSRRFHFVRVDLYSIGNAVYFGEFTFAPEGGAGALSSETFGAVIMEKIRLSLSRQEVEP